MSHIKRKTIIGFLLGVIALLLILLSPVLIWFMSDESTSDVVIIDKTIPDKTYREHKGLTWILNYNKWIKNNGMPYNASEDYIGFHPGNGEEFSTDSFPDSLVGKDLIYLADAYGVYEEDWYGKASEGDRSEIIYGGMTQEEVSLISEAVQKGSTFIAEFNAFGSPTEEKAREGLYSTLNLEWSGWIGRYFDDLSVGGEVPGWAIKNFEQQYDQKWEFSEQGLIFVNEDDSIIVIEKEDIGEQTVQFSFSEKGLEWIEDSLVKESMSYHYWFDIVEPIDDEDILANYTVDVSQEAEKSLEDAGIPLSFPAVMKHNHSYYFAGDYADHGGDMNFHQYKWLPEINRLLTTGDNETLEAFYWKVYMPMMETILQNLEDTDNKREESHVNIPTIQGVQVAGKVGEDKIQVFQDGEWEDLIIKGVNMGIAKPGSFPGEAAITKTEYKRWFEQISDMNANAVRIYTIHPPAFYEALLEHNKEADKPLYLFHGVWVEEEPLLKTQDAFAKENTQLLEKATKDTVDLIHGNATIKKKVGHAGGRYTADVSPYVLGWVLGIEWDPEVVVATNEKHRDMKQYNGSFLATKDASPFEVWIAKMMDDTVRYEMEKYNYQRPVSFTNWVTTDLLAHPAEPSEKEDLVSVDPNVIRLKEDYYAGQFASYHIYPYYPDFLNYEEEYVNYVDQNGDKNNYAGYLNALRKVHKMPVLVAEFGVPASRGMTHRNVYGMNQGGNPEEKQGKIDAKLFENIVSENYAGGMVFSWQDEWFKRTWNTMDFDNEDRRPFWSNDQTNEQQFGLLSFDPGEKLKIKVDGDVTDWKGEEPLFESTDKAQNLQRFFMTSDEKYMYFRLDYQNMSSEQMERDKTMLLFDTISGQGSKNISKDPELQTTDGIDFILNLTGKDTSRLTVHSYYDAFYYQYAEDLGLIEEKNYASKKDNDVFHPIRLALNKQLTIPSTRETFPFDDYETGILTYGNGNPESEDYNSLSDFIVKGNSIEIRLPWALFNVKDPSEKEIMGDMWKEGLKALKTVDRFNVGVVMYEGNVEGASLSLTSIKEIKPSTKNGQLDEFYEFTWDNWKEPHYHERLKQSYYIMQEEYGRYKE